jgi:hypothetical protein
MSLSQINSALQSSNKHIGDLEKALAEHPNDPAISLMLKSTLKHRSRLEEEFENVTRALGLDVCNYRAFGRTEKLISSVFQVILKFQDLVTLVFAAVSSGKPRRSRSVGQEHREATSFGFSHAYEGSTGIVMTLPNDRLLFSESELDETMNAVFQMAKLTSASAIKEFADRFGIAIIRGLYSWGTSHVENDLGADIDWRRGDEIRSSVFVEPPQLQNLRMLIDETSDTEEEHFDLLGTMVGADTDSRRFHFRTTSGEEIRGEFSDAISETQVVVLPHEYKVKVTKKTTIRYSIDEERVEYFIDAIL